MREKCNEGRGNKISKVIQLRTARGWRENLLPKGTNVGPCGKHLVITEKGSGIICLLILEDSRIRKLQTNPAVKVREFALVLGVHDMQEVFERPSGIEDVDCFFKRLEEPIPDAVKYSLL